MKKKETERVVRIALYLDEIFFQKKYCQKKTGFWVAISVVEVYVFKIASQKEYSCCLVF